MQCEEFITGKHWQRIWSWVTCKTLTWSQFSDVGDSLEWKICPEHGQLEGAVVTKKAPFGDGMPVPCISSFLQTHDSLKKRREMKAGKTKSKCEGFQLCQLPLAKAVKSWAHKRKQASSCKGCHFTPSPAPSQEEYGLLLPHGSWWACRPSCTLAALSQSCGSGHPSCRGVQWGLCAHYVVLPSTPTAELGTSLLPWLLHVLLRSWVRSGKSCSCQIGCWIKSLTSSSSSFFFFLSFFGSSLFKLPLLFHV